jgi:hypothetical protein
VVFNKLVNYINRILKWNKDLLYSRIENKCEEWRQQELLIAAEEKRWHSVRLKQQQAEREREEDDRLATERFIKDMEDIVRRKRHKTVLVRRVARRIKNMSHVTYMRHSVRSRRSHERKSDAAILRELSKQQTPEQLKKWLYRNLSLVFFPRNESDPYWNEKNKLMHEIITHKDDLNKLIEIARVYKSDWYPYLLKRMS